MYDSPNYAKLLNRITTIGERDSMQEIRRIDVVSLAKIEGALGAVIGLIVGIFAALIGVAMGGLADMAGTGIPGM
jgi:hypothetical protein